MAMKVSTTATIALVQALFLILIALPSFSQKLSSSKQGHRGRGYIMRLIHHDSPQSPFYNPNATPADLWKSAVHRSFLRHNYMQSSLASANYSPMQGVILPASRITNEYFTKLIIGTPPTEVMAALDTGSHLVWVSCFPCDGCSNKPGNFFDPSKSFTYGKVDCQTTTCNSFHEAGQCSTDQKCAYTVRYLGGSHSSGILSYDNFTMPTRDDDVVSFPHTIFGCSNEMGGGIKNYGIGIVGLSRSQYSLVGQLGMNFNWKFSYCLESRTIGGGGDLSLGDATVLLGNSTHMGAISTPDGPLYVLKLIDISVGSVKLGIRSESIGPTLIGKDGDIFIDSGAALTYLETDAYYKLLTKLKDVIKLKPTYHPYPHLCYPGGNEDLTETNFPVVTFNFLNLDVDLPPTNTFVLAGYNTLCLAMTPSSDIQVFGNIAQQNMSVGYDLQNQKIYIAPTGCHQD